MKVIKDKLEQVKKWYKRFSSVPLENLIALLVICQILDGVLTYAGVTLHGIGQEGNPLLRSLMAEFDPFSVLFMVKLSAIMLLFVIKDLHVLTKKNLPFVIPCLHIILIVYTVCAIVPWASLLIGEFIKQNILY
jgi:hypothetical protein